MVWRRFNQLLTSYNAATRCPGPFPDQCAIELGQALEGAGVSTASFKGVRCWGDPKGNHIIRAEQLAEWIGGHVFAGRGTTRSLDPKNFQAEIAGKTGIIFSRITGNAARRRTPTAAAITSTFGTKTRSAVSGPGGAGVSKSSSVSFLT